jgi:hypothetical protein
MGFTWQRRAADGGNSRLRALAAGNHGSVWRRAVQGLTADPAGC